MTKWALMRVILQGIHSLQFPFRKGVSLMCDQNILPKTFALFVRVFSLYCYQILASGAIVFYTSD